MLRILLWIEILPFSPTPKTVGLKHAHLDAFLIGSSAFLLIPPSGLILIQQLTRLSSGCRYCFSFSTLSFYRLSGIFSAPRVSMKSRSWHYVSRGSTIEHSSQRSARQSKVSRTRPEKLAVGNTAHGSVHPLARLWPKIAPATLESQQQHDGAM